MLTVRRIRQLTRNRNLNALMKPNCRSVYVTIDCSKREGADAIPGDGCRSGGPLTKGLKVHPIQMLARAPSASGRYDGNQRAGEVHEGHGDAAGGGVDGCHPCHASRREAAPSRCLLASTLVLIFLPTLLVDWDIAVLSGYFTFLVYRSITGGVTCT